MIPEDITLQSHQSNLRRKDANRVCQDEGYDVILSLEQWTQVRLTACVLIAEGRGEASQAQRLGDMIRPLHDTRGWATKPVPKHRGLRQS